MPCSPRRAGRAAFRSRRRAILPPRRVGARNRRPKRQQSRDRADAGRGQWHKRLRCRRHCPPPSPPRRRRLGQRRGRARPVVQPRHGVAIDAVIRRRIAVDRRLRPKPGRASQHVLLPRPLHQRRQRRIVSPRRIGQPMVQVAVDLAFEPGIGGPDRAQRIQGRSHSGGPVMGQGLQHGFGQIACGELLADRFYPVADS